MVFYDPSAYVTIPNLNIGEPDFTIAFWIRLPKPNQRVIILGWLRSVICFEISVSSRRRDSYFSVYQGIDHLILGISSVVFNWTHIAATCEQDKVTIFINGETFWTYGITTRECRNPIKKFGVASYSSPLIMDLHIFGFALPPDEIHDLSRGKQVVYFMNRLNTLFHEIITYNRLILCQ